MTIATVAIVEEEIRETVPVWIDSSSTRCGVVPIDGLTRELVVHFREVEDGVEDYDGVSKRFAKVWHTWDVHPERVTQSDDVIDKSYCSALEEHDETPEVGPLRLPRQSRKEESEGHQTQREQPKSEYQYYEVNHSGCS